MFKIFVAGPDLSLVDSPYAFREAFQRVAAIENTARPRTKRVDYNSGIGGLQKHDGSRVVSRGAQALQNFETGLRAILKLGTDERDVRIVRFRNDLLLTPSQGCDSEISSNTAERTRQQLTPSINLEEEIKLALGSGQDQSGGHSSFASA